MNKNRVREAPMRQIWQCIIQMKLAKCSRGSSNLNQRTMMPERSTISPRKKLQNFMQTCLINLLHGMLRMQLRLKVHSIQMARMFLRKLKRKPGQYLEMNLPQQMQEKNLRTRRQLRQQTILIKMVIKRQRNLQIEQKTLAKKLLKRLVVRKPLVVKHKIVAHCM